MNVFLSLLDAATIDTRLNELNQHIVTADPKKKTSGAYQQQCEKLQADLKTQQELAAVYGVGSLAFVIPELRKLEVQTLNPLAGLKMLHEELSKDLVLAYDIKTTTKLRYIGFDNIAANLDRLFRANACHASEFIPFEMTRQPVFSFDSLVYQDVIDKAQQKLVATNKNLHVLNHQIYKTTKTVVGLSRTWDLQVLLAVAVRMGINDTWQTTST